jgi:ribonuclease III
MASKRLDELENHLGITFENQELLKLALVHRSYLNERGGVHQSNERLEFLGDAVLSLIVADYLYKNYPERPEGELTDLRSALVRRETLSKWATNLNLGQYLLLGRGEAQTGGRSRALTLASAFEAVLAAIYVERGLEGATAWLLPLIEPELTLILAEGRHLDFKGLLQKALQNHYHQTPSYYTVEESGPEHERVYVIEVRLNDHALGRGSGLTKQIAQQAAAREALTYFESLTPEALTSLASPPSNPDNTPI